MDFNGKFSKLANGEHIKSLRVAAPTSDVVGPFLEKLIVKEIYVVVYKGSLDEPKKPYVTMGAFIISYGDKQTLPDIRFGLARCSPRDRFSLRKGKKMAKMHAFRSSKEYGYDWNFMPVNYWKIYDDFKAQIAEFYSDGFIGRPGFSTGLNMVTCTCKDVTFKSFYKSKNSVFINCYHCDNFIPWNALESSNKRGTIKHFFKK
jgi:hypothetical protein